VASNIFDPNVKITVVYYTNIYIYIWSAIATNNFFIIQILTTCFGPYGPSSGENVSTSKITVLWDDVACTLNQCCEDPSVRFVLLYPSTRCYIPENRMFQYCIQKSPLLVTTHSQINPVSTPYPTPLNIFHIILITTTRRSKKNLPFKICGHNTAKNFSCLPLVKHASPASSLT
jgi:hypothetical protein